MATKSPTKSPTEGNVSRKNSTNVRISFSQGLLPAAFGALQHLSTSLAADAARRLFFRAPKRAHGPSLASLSPPAQVLAIPFGKRTLVGYDWGNGEPESEDESPTPTVLLVHGWGGRASQLRRFVAPLQRAGFRVVGIDAPGHGASPGAMLSIPRFADALHAAVRVVGPLHAIIAHSLGSPAAALAISQGLPVERAAFLGPPADAALWFTQFSDYLDLNPSTRALARARAEAALGIAFASLAAESIGPSLRLPLLVVHDKRDREVPYTDGQRVAAAAPNATFVATEGLGHRRILADEKTIAATVNWIAGNSWPTAAARCSHCGAERAERWDKNGQLCMTCGADAELGHRQQRAL